MNVEGKWASNSPVHIRGPLAIVTEGGVVYAANSDTLSLVSSCGCDNYWSNGYDSSKAIPSGYDSPKLRGKATGKGFHDPATTDLLLP